MNLSACTLQWQRLALSSRYMFSLGSIDSFVKLALSSSTRYRLVPPFTFNCMVSSFSSYLAGMFWITNIKRACSLVSAWGYKNRVDLNNDNAIADVGAAVWFMEQVLQPVPCDPVRQHIYAVAEPVVVGHGGQVHLSVLVVLPLPCKK